MSANHRACDRCRSLRKRCDCRDGVYPCSRCERNGATCTHARFKKPHSRDDRNADVSPAQNEGEEGENKRKRGGERHNHDHSFWDALADVWILASLATLGPTHWGLQNMLYALTARAYAQGSAALLSRATALVQSLGVGLRDVTGPFAHGIRHTLDTTFGAFSVVPMQHHDRARGLAPQPWTPESLGERLVGIVKGVNSGSGFIGMSPAFTTILGEKLVSELVVSITPILFIGKTLLQDRDVHRGVQALIYLVEQYTSKSVGPLSVKVPEVTTKSGVQYDIYMTLWGEELGNLCVVFELVAVSTASGVAAEPAASAVSIDDVPGEELAAARSLTNLMWKGK